MHEPLSHRLARILESDAGKEDLTLNQLMIRTEGRGLYLVIILLSLPFITPIPLPGISTVVGVVIALLGFRLALGLPPRLPRFMGERPLPPGLKQSVLGGSVKMLRWIEKLARPRRTQWLGWPAVRTGHDHGNASSNFERLEELVRDLADRHVRLKQEHATLRRTLADREARLRALDADLRDANQCRQDAVKRIDDLCAQLERVEADLDRRLSAGASE